MQYDEIVAHIQQNGGPEERDTVERALIAVLEVLGERIAGQEPSNLAAQLPSELKHPLTQHTGDAERFDAAEFLRRVAEREGTGHSEEQAQEHVRLVFAALNSAVTSGEFRDVLSQLPTEYERLLPA